MTIAPIISSDSLNDTWIAQKYAPQMGVSADSLLKSIRIYHFINHWDESPYYLETKFGINDFTFVQKFYQDIFMENTPDNFGALVTFRKLIFFKRYTCIKQGDVLVFQELNKERKVVFRTVGVYLTNGKFVLCSPVTGKVTIEKLYQSYWFKRLLKAGRLRTQTYLED